MKRTSEGWAEGGLLIEKVSKGWWHVTHQMSGLCIDTGINKISEAREIVERLLGTGIDFTREAEYLKLQGREILEVLRSAHADLGLIQLVYEQETGNGN